MRKKNKKRQTKTHTVIFPYTLGLTALGSCSLALGGTLATGISRPSVMEMLR